MLSFWRLTPMLLTALSPFLTGITFDLPLFADASYPTVPNLEGDTLCYMQTADGRTLNLNALCSQQLPSASDANTRKEVQISAVRYSGNLIRGQVTNQTSQSVKAVKVNYEVLDNQGNSIDAGFIDAQPSTIPPGGSASFKQTINYPGAKVQTTFVNWSY